VAKQESVLKAVGVGSKSLAAVLHVLQDLPLVDVKHDLAGPLNAGGQATLLVTLKRSRKPPSHVHAPKFPKRVQEAWWLVLGDAGSGELLALRRLQFAVRTTTQLTFEVPPHLEGRRCVLQLYLLSDVYQGLDQQYEVAFSVAAKLPGQDGDLLAEDDGAEDVDDDGREGEEEGREGAAGPIEEDAEDAT